MFMIKKWEIFYTDSLNSDFENDEELVDQILIDSLNKRYILNKDADILVTDSIDEFGNEDYSMYISRFMFDLILEGLKNKGFKEVPYYEE